MREETQGVAYFCVEPTAGFKASKALDFAAEKSCGQKTMRIIVTLQRGPCREGCSVGGDVWAGIRCSGCGSSLPAGSKFPLKSHLFSSTVDGWVHSNHPGQFFRREWLGLDVGAPLLNTLLRNRRLCCSVALDSLLACPLSRASRMGGGWIEALTLFCLKL